MSKYTTQVRWIVEMNSLEYKDHSISYRIEKACPKIFNFTFPIYKEDHRLELEKKILMHYYTREIGFETVELWKLYLEEKMNLIMPYYNKLYEMVEKDFLYDYDMSEEFTRNTSDNGEQNFEGSGNTSGTGKSTTVNSEFPQSTLNDLDYASSSIQTDSESNSETENTSKQTNENTREEIYNNSKKGRTQPLANIIKDYQDNLMNIDFRIINDLSDLFMNLY